MYCYYTKKCIIFQEDKIQREVLSYLNAGVGGGFFSWELPVEEGHAALTMF
jgi:hypothetical protein